LSCPKFLIGHPDIIEKTGLRLIDSSIRRGEKTAGMSTQKGDGISKEKSKIFYSLSSISVCGNYILFDINH